ncbi:MAG TPA: hypothetical protein VFG20_11475 [Planctomycetaceae bacterium]|nr:hypothetical protein [Planctomycetaceae bacterium]
MDVLQRITRQFMELYRSMAPSQRATLVVVPLMVLVGFGWLLLQPKSDGLTALSWGKVYTTEELIAAEQAFLQEGLKDFRREGQRIMVPAADVDKYNAALLKFDAMPADLGGQLLKQYETMGPFSTEKERQERKEAMLLQEVRRVIRAVPEIQDARVAIASSGRRGFGPKSKTTANVTVTPRNRRELSPRLVSSIQAAVSSMVPDLKPSDVTVFDVVNGVSYKGDAADEPFDSKLISRTREFESNYQQQIQRDLSYIPDVGVTVHVDVDKVKSEFVRSQVIDPKKTAALFSQEMKIKDTMQQQPSRGEPGQVANRPGSVGGAPGMERNRQFADESSQALNGVSFETSEKELIAAMPKAVQVSVGIPRDYYRSVAAQRKAAGETEQAKLDPAKIEETVLANVKKSVKALIPADSPATAVEVTSVDHVSNILPDVKPSVVESLNVWTKDWGGTVMMGVMAIIALMMVRRSMPALPADTPPAFAPQASVAAAASDESKEVEAPREVTQRDMLQGLVRDNPEATAAIISRWLQAAK